MKIAEETELSCMKELTIFILIFFLMLNLSGCDELTTEEKAVVEAFTRDMREDCLGRMIVAVPRRFQWSPFSLATLYYGKGSDFRTIEVSVVDMSVESTVFERRVNERIAEIQSHVSLESGSSIFRSEKKGADGARFIERYESIETIRAVTYEAHVLIEGVQVFITADSYPGDGALIGNRVERFVSEIEVMKSGGVGRADGFCLGPLLINSSQDYEVATFQTLRGRGQEGVDFGFYTSSMERSGSGETLGGRVDEASDILGGVMTVLRKGRVSVAGEMSEEALLRFEQLEGRHSLSFGLWSMRATPSLSTPSFTLEMSTATELASGDAAPDNRNPIAYEPSRNSPAGRAAAVKFDSKLTDREAIGIWDAVVGSVRYR